MRNKNQVTSVTGGRCAGLVAAVNELLPEVRYQRCMVHFERNILAKVNPKKPRLDGGRPEVRILHGIAWQGSGECGILHQGHGSEEVRDAAGCLLEGIGETTTYLLNDYPRDRRRRIRTDNMIERLNRKIRWSTRVVGSFPDGRSAHAHLRVRPLRDFQRMVDAPLPRHVPTG